MNRCIARTLLLCSLIALLAGCNANGGSRQMSLSVWQTQVQTYVTKHANGDMNALRDVQITPGQPGFRTFSTDRPENSKDFAGVLVGVQTQNDRIWYVYLVGEVNKEQVTSILPAAVSFSGGEYTWRVGDDDKNATAAYLALRQKAWQQKHDDAQPPHTPLGFPAAADQFTMQASGDAITIHDGASAAQWTLNLTDQQPSQGKSK